MGWSIGYDDNWKRDIGYGVPATCDHPDCNASIDRGLSHVCGSEPYGGEHGCGLYFCREHVSYATRGVDRDVVDLCPRCIKRRKPFDAKPDVREWIEHKLTDPSWQQWRDENAAEVAKLRDLLAAPSNGGGDEHRD